MRTVIEETQRTATAGGVVNHLSNHRTFFVEEQLVTNTNLTGWLYQHIPQAQLLVELTQQEHLNLRIGFLLSTKETGRKHLCIVEHKDVALVEVVDDILEGQVVGSIITVSIFLEHVNGLTLTVYHHQAALVAMIHFLHTTVFVLKDAMGRLQGYLVLRQLEFEL